MPTAVIEMGRRDAQRISVGKAKGHHSFSQAQINTLIVRLAGEGKRVARLKGGDPMVFGRAGEEIAALRKAGIPYTIVPGISAALAAAADTATPVTLRKRHRPASSWRRHTAPTMRKCRHWAAARHVPGLTLRRSYMGKIDRAWTMAARLHWRADWVRSVPVGIVVNAGRPGRAVFIRGSLGELAAAHTVDFVDGPAVILIGPKRVAAGDWEVPAAAMAGAAVQGGVMEILTGNELISGATVYLDRQRRTGSRGCRMRRTFAPVRTRRPSATRRSR